MQVKAVYTGDTPDVPFRPFELTISVTSTDEDEALRKFGTKNVSIPQLLVDNANLSTGERRALKSMQQRLLDAREHIAEPAGTASVKVSAARLKQ